MNQREFLLTKFCYVPGKCIDYRKLNQPSPSFQAPRTTNTNRANSLRTQKMLAILTPHFVLYEFIAIITTEMVNYSNQNWATQNISFRSISLLYELNEIIVIWYLG